MPAGLETRVPTPPGYGHDAHAARFRLESGYRDGTPDLHLCGVRLEVRATIIYTTVRASACAPSEASLLRQHQQQFGGRGLHAVVDLLAPWCSRAAALLELAGLWKSKQNKTQSHTGFVRGGRGESPLTPAVSLTQVCSDILLRPRQRHLAL